jgi:hypothetical protein
MWKEATVAQFEVGLQSQQGLEVLKKVAKTLSRQPVSALRYKSGIFHLRIRSTAFWTVSSSTWPQHGQYHLMKSGCNSVEEVLDLGTWFRDIQ